MNNKIILTSLGGVLIIGAGLLSLFIGGKNSAGVALDEQAKTFGPPIDAYLKARSFGMKLEKLQKLDVDDSGDIATATCIMKDAEGMYNLGVKWMFTFEKSKDGKWQVKGHEAE